MNDPHVVRLNYKVTLAELVHFTSRPQASWTTDEGDIRIDGEDATIELTNHYATIDEAKDAVQSYIDAWEIWGGLTSAYDRRPFTLSYQRGELVDRAAIPGDVSAHASAVFSMTASAVVSVELQNVPSPPSNFVVSPELKNMWYRWEQYRSDRERLPHMGYYCLTVLEHDVGSSGRGSRQLISHKLGIDIAVLSKLGELVSAVGSEDEARKARRPHNRAYTDNERAWIETTVKMIIKRFGEASANPTGSYPVMDLVSLPTV